MCFRSLSNHPALSPTHSMAMPGPFLSLNVHLTIPYPRLLHNLLRSFLIAMSVKCPDTFSFFWEDEHLYLQSTKWSSVASISSICLCLIFQEISDMQDYLAQCSTLVKNVFMHLPYYPTLSRHSEWLAFHRYGKKNGTRNIGHQFFIKSTKVNTTNSTWEHVRNIF